MKTTLITLFSLFLIGHLSGVPLMHRRAAFTDAGGGTWTQVLDDAGTGARSLGSSSSNEYAAGSFTAANSGYIDDLTVMVIQVGSDEADTFTVGIYDDNSGEPGSLLGAAESFDFGDISGAWADLPVTFSTPPNITSGNTYWVVLQAGQIDAASYVRIRRDPAGTENYSEADSTPTWSLIDGTAHIRATLNGTDGNPPDNTLILRLKMDEGLGTAVADETANNHDFTLSGATWITGKSGSGGALSFDGTNDFMDSDSTVNFGTDIITVCAWINWDTNADDDDIFMETSAAWFSNNHSFLINPNSSSPSSWYVGLRGTAVGRAEHITRPTAGSWTHYAVTFDNSTAGGDIKIWVDGVEQSTTIATDTKAGTGNIATQTINIMARNGGASLHAAGDIDDIRIYEGELTTAEVEHVRDNPDE